MNGKEYVQSFHYFDKRTLEEDLPVVPSNNIQDKYEQLEIIFEDFFDDNCLSQAKQNSKEEREKKGLSDSSFVYGEITFRSLAYICEYIKTIYGQDTLNNSTFIDLGSGIGRGVIAAAFLFPFKKCIGIEYLEKLHFLALDIKSKYEKQFEDVFKSLYQEYFSSHLTIPEIELINGDFLSVDWSTASVILANSTCFSAELMVAISKKAEREVRPGAFVISFTKRLPNLSENWEIQNGFRKLMSWGIATIYIHRKKVLDDSY